MFFATIRRVCRLHFCTCWKPFPPAARAFLPQVPGEKLPGEHETEQQRKQPVKHTGWAIALCSSAMTSAKSTARQGAPIANAVGQKGRKRRKPNIPLPRRGGRVPSPPGPRRTAVATYTLCLPLFHPRACLLGSLSFPLHDGFISGL